MKKYFISFVYTKEGNFSLADCVKTSFEESININLLRMWENGINKNSKGVERADILFFKEVK